MNQYIREPINAYTHLIGAGLSFIGTILLLIYGGKGSPLTTTAIVSITIFGLSLVHFIQLVAFTMQLEPIKLFYLNLRN